MPDRIVDIRTELPYVLRNLSATGEVEQTTTGTADSFVRYSRRPEVTRTPKGKWRPPTNYFHVVEEGNHLDGPIIGYRGYRKRKSSGKRHDGAEYQGAHSFAGYAYPGRPAFPLNLEGRAVNDALLSIKDQKINLGVAFGERKETAEFVTSTVKKTFEVMRAVRKKDLREVKRLLLGQKKRQRSYRTTLHEVLDAPSSLWLQNSYAVRPLVADVYGACEALNEKESNDPDRYGVIGKSMMMEKFKHLRTNTAAFGSVYVPFQRVQAGFHGCFVRLDYTIENPFLRSLSQLGITNPLSIGWELVPFSFVADWFLPVGDYLDAQDATLGLHFRGGSCSKITRTQVYHTRHPDEQPYTKGSLYVVDYVEYANISGGGKQTWMSRSTYQKSPRPMMPTFESPFSFPRLTSAIALVTQLTSRRSRR